MDGSIRAVALRPEPQHPLTPAEMAWKIVWAIDADTSKWTLREMAKLLARELDYAENKHD